MQHVFLSTYMSVICGNRETVAGELVDWQWLWCDGCDGGIRLNANLDELLYSDKSYAWTNRHVYSHLTSTASKSRWGLRSFATVNFGNYQLPSPANIIHTSIQPMVYRAALSAGVAAQQDYSASSSLRSVITMWSGSRTLHARGETGHTLRSRKKRSGNCADLLALHVPGHN